MVTETAFWITSLLILLRCTFCSLHRNLVPFEIKGIHPFICDKIVLVKYLLYVIPTHIVSIC